MGPSPELAAMVPGTWLPCSRPGLWLSLMGDASSHTLVREMVRQAQSSEPRRPLGNASGQPGQA